MTEHDDSTAPQPEDLDTPAVEVEADEVAERDLSADATVPAVPALSAGLTLPPGAGWRADRRARRGASLTTGLWLAAAMLVALAAGVLTLHLLYPPPEPISLSAAPGAEALAAIGAVREASASALEEGAAVTRATAQALVNSLAAPPLVVLAPETTENLDKLRAEADSLVRLRERLAAAYKQSDGSLQLVLLDAKGKIVRTWGELPAEAPALTSACSSLLAEQPLPAPRLGALSAARPDGHRVALLAVGPVLAEAQVGEAAQRAQAADARGLALRTRLVELGTQIDASRAQRLWIVAAAVGGALLALLLLLLFTWQPLRRGLAAFLGRTGARAAGQPLAELTALPVELATADDLVMAAFSVARRETDEGERREDLQAQLAELTELCKRAADGDLSARAEPGPGQAGTLAVDLNFLIESFERRAMRLRSHARAGGDENPDTGQRDEAMAHLRKRVAALGPLPGLLRDVAARLKTYADAAAKEQDVSAEQRKLAEAVAARSRTAKAYLSALGEAVDGAERSALPPVSAQIEQELAELTLDESFAGQVGALRDLGAEEIHRRLDEEKQQATAEEPESPAAE